MSAFAIGSRRTTLTSALIFLLGVGGSMAAETSAQAASPQTPPSTTGSGKSVALASSDSGTAVLQRANAFIATLSDAQRAALLQEYTFANAARWHTYPQWGLGRRQARIGLRLSTLSAEQWDVLNALLAAATGSGRNEGYDEIQQHLAADDWIGQNGGGNGYGRGNFYVAFLGTPSNTDTWQLQFGGHHLALTNTYRGGVLVGVTPSFRGIEPHTAIRHGGATLRPQLDELEAFVALLASLDPRQRAAAELADEQDELLLGSEARNKDWNFPARAQGVPASSLSGEQRALLVKAISLYVNDVADANAASILARYERELDSTYLSFSGSTSLTRTGDYVRIDGPSVWIEMVMDPPYSTNQPHTHAIWRDKRADYGGTRG
jgi:hypothetical protein